MTDSGRWWLPLTIGVGAAAALTAFQIITRPDDTSESCDVMENDIEQSPSSGVMRSPVCDKSMDNAETTQLDEPVASTVSRDVTNTDPVLEESFCQVSPKSTPDDKADDKADDGGRSWRWFYNS